jgi:hypothetical protein
MDALIDWLEFLVRVGLGIGLIVFCAMRAKRAGGGAYLLASLGAINVLLSLVGRVMSHMTFEHSPVLVFRMMDASLTGIAALLVFVGLVLLR